MSVQAGSVKYGQALNSTAWLRRQLKRTSIRRAG
jgi:hypothetical protein